MKKTRSGFTIVELLIVIVVIGILAAITIVAYNGTQARGKYTANQSSLNQINKLIQLYYADNGVYPGNTIYTGTGGSFIPGLVPTYTASLPTIADMGTGDYWAYITNSTDYKLVRLTTSPGVLSSVETQGNTRIDSTRPTRGWGVWSSGGSAF